MSDIKLSESDKQFYQRADAYIDMANKQVSESVTPGDVSASAMYAIARYNAYISAADFGSVDAFKAERAEITQYFVEEYRKMLDEHLDDYTENFNEYMQIG